MLYSPIVRSGEASQIMVSWIEVAATTIESLAVLAPHDLSNSI